MKTISCIILLLSCSLHVVAQLNIIPQNGGLKEYTIDNALPYDSLSNVDKRSFSSLPGQTLYMHGMKNVNQGYYEVFWTGSATVSGTTKATIDSSGTTAVAGTIVKLN